MRRAAPLVAVVALAACTSAPPPAPAAGRSSASAVPSPVASADYRPGPESAGDSLFPAEGDAGYDVSHYDIAISYDPATKKLSGDTTVTASATQDLSRFALDLHGLTVRSVTVDGVAAAYTRSKDKLVVTPARGIGDGVVYRTRVVYGGVPSAYQDPQLGMEGFVASGPGALAQGEPDVAASWFPVNDHPSDKATYDVAVTAPASLSALSNGVLERKTTAGGATTWRWDEDEPMASYLAFVAIGDYRVATSTHDGMPVVLAVDARLPSSIDKVLARTPEIVDFLATWFGPYPFDAEGGVVHDDPRFRFALENQTRPVYSSLFFGKSAGDPTVVIAHELAHQWYGDSVSVADWSDVWLNEGFASYAEWLWTQHEGGPSPKQQFDDVYYGRDGKSLIRAAPAEPTVRTLFGDEVYTRGGATLEALRITVGDTAFFQILRQWAAQRRYGNGDTADFIALAERVSGKSLDAFFHAWLYESGKPPYPKPL